MNYGKMITVFNMIGIVCLVLEWTYGGHVVYWPRWYTWAQLTKELSFALSGTATALYVVETYVIDPTKRGLRNLKKK